MSRDATIILLVGFILLGLAWKPLQQKGQLNLSGSSSIGNNSASKTTSVESEDVRESIKEAERKVESIEKRANELEQERNRSPYYNKITMSYVASLNNPDPSKEYITLYTNLKRGERVDISGWYLKSDSTGNWVSIGGVSILPFPYTQNALQDIVVQNGDRVYLVKGFSPIGIAFRTNKCTGYFGSDRKFYPSIQKSCPLIKNEDLPKFSNVLDREDECLDIIDRIPRCSVPKQSQVRDFPDTVTESCKDYLLTQVNYNTCLANHFSDTDFPGHEYYYYFKVFGPLWRSHRENIKLYDRNNLVVDSININ